MNWWVHTYNGPAALVNATRVSVNGISAAGFIVEAHAALVDVLETIAAIETTEELVEWLRGGVGR